MSGQGRQPASGLSFAGRIGHLRARMTPAIASTLMPLLRRMDPERAHGVALLALRLGLGGRDAAVDDPALSVSALGRTLPNPIGLAAGFDKNAVAARALMRLGFGFVETGTVTPRPQVGNPRPRIFRLEQDRAVINRLGFNNAGLEAYLRRLARLRSRRVMLGANLGINKEGAEPERDYPALVSAVAELVDYVVINVSSPNTPGLRDLQGEARLTAILLAIGAAVPQRPPLLVKVAPDLSPAGLEAVVEAAVAGGAQGLIVSNTTLSRPAGLQSARADEAGGLSGAPLRPLATAMLARAFLAARGRLVLVGVGGVASGADALEKIRAGATLVQIYTGLAYAGPALIPRVKHELAAGLRAAGFAQLRDAVGTDAARLAGAL
jgi:dihydroorotate dehydrogenase